MAAFVDAAAQPAGPLKYIVGRDGAVFTIADLPPSTTQRWVIRRKADVVAAVQGGLISTEDACARYRLTPEEFASWRCSVESFGLKGLRVTRVQDYRHRRTQQIPRSEQMTCG
jgi:hypothetical protein